MMRDMQAFTRNHPVAFVLMSTLAWLVLLAVFMGIASSAFHVPYGGAGAGTAGRLAVTACVLLLAWRLGWLETAGVLRPGGWRVWLLALGAMVYLAGASLYSLFGSVSFEWASLLRRPGSGAAVTTHFAAGLSEELLFRGLALHALVRVWGSTKPGMLGSIVLTSLLFAGLHLTQTFTYGVSLSSALLLVLQTCVVSVWWGALVVAGGSIWPAVMLHAGINALVAVQGLAVPAVEPAIAGYTLLLWFSLPLGLLGILIVATHRTTDTLKPGPWRAAQG